MTKPPSRFSRLAKATPALTTATEVTMDWSDRPEVVWRFDEGLGAYVRFNRDTPHDWLARDGDREQIAADTLLVLTARKYTASPSSGKGTPVPALDTLGTGSALLFYDGGLLQGTWERDSYDDLVLAEACVGQRDGAAGRQDYGSLSSPPRVASTGSEWTQRNPDRGGCAQAAAHSLRMVAAAHCELQSTPR